MTSDFEGFSIPDFIYYIYFPILNIEKEPVFPFWMLSAKQGHYWYHFYNVFGITRSLNPGPPALEASTIPLGYRGGGIVNNKEDQFTIIPSTNETPDSDTLRVQLPF